MSLHDIVLGYPRLIIFLSGRGDKQRNSETTVTTENHVNKELELHVMKQSATKTWTLTIK